MAFIPSNKTASTQKSGEQKAKVEYAGRAYNAKSKKGEDYIKIQIAGGKTYLMFVNKNKKEDKHPDFNLIEKTSTK
jgi:uncharacterized protein (DUF736 family)